MFIVDANLCTGHTCGICVRDVPTVYKWDSNGKAIVFHQPDHYEEVAALKALNDCPKKAISQRETGELPPQEQ